MRATKLLFPVVILIAIVSTAAEARQRCQALGETDKPRIDIKLGIRIGPVYTREEQEVFDKMALRQEGINARRATRTSDGCIEAFVSDGSGGFDTLYFRPGTLEQVE